MDKHHLGAIPFLSKWNSKRNIRSLEKKLKKASKKFCELKTKVDGEKIRAAGLFTKNDYDDIVGRGLEVIAENTCDCAEASVDKREGPVKGARDCADKMDAELKKVLSDDLKGLDKGQRTDLLKALHTNDKTGSSGALVGGQDKTRSKKQEEELKKCQEGIDVDYDTLAEEVKEKISQIKKRKKTPEPAMSGRRRRRR